MALKFDRQGLIPAIVQDAETRQVLMVAYMNEESIELTRQTGDAWFWSRSRQELWHKGDTSGNFQHVVQMHLDCDADAVLLEVRPDGPACHTGATSCFYQTLEEATAGEAEAPAALGAAVVDELAEVIAGRHREMPEGSYVASLLKAGIDRVAKKVGEEAAESIIAAKNGAHDEIVWEVADLWFHSLVLLEATGVPVVDVWAELERRRK
ncbi:MAG: phosphoribosyl-AMP cyclohydrolase / phosphoribosyl-ATP pyrophosphohydrolase [Chloroflexota bacterium]|nr:phosphoribosyl-AMP cyclohydrolase / phosphoribosyl-ATP pyrophosphohydrolase [Chloroflexota bacterium]